MHSPFHFGEHRYQPQPGYKYAEDPELRVDQRWLAAIVGLVAVAMPLVLFVSSIPGRLFRESISHYYYAPVLGILFVGSMVFIGTFLIVYRGLHRDESIIATISGFCAYGVALFPTSGSGVGSGPFPARPLAEMSKQMTNGVAVYRIEPLNAGADPYFSLFPGAAVLHFTCAAVLFLFLAYYSFFVFTRVTPDQKDGDRLQTNKKIRNSTYYVTGGLIVLSIAVLVIKQFFPDWTWWNAFNLTFWFETLALVSFGFAWLVKGRFFMTALMDADDVMDKAAQEERKRMHN